MKRRDLLSLITTRIFAIVLWAVIGLVLVPTTLLAQEQEISNVREISVDKSDLIFEGTVKGAEIGYDIDSGDFDGDGLADLAFVRWCEKRWKKGHVDFFLGKSLKSMTGIHTPEEADISLSVPSGNIYLDTGDFNGDGKDDLLIVWPGYKKGLCVVLSGEEFLQSGEKEMDRLPRVEIVNSSKDKLYMSGRGGSASAVLSDWNGDNIADLVIRDTMVEITREGMKVEKDGKILVIFGSKNPPASIDIAKQTDLTIIAQEPDIGVWGKLKDINRDKIIELVQARTEDSQRQEKSGSVRFYRLPKGGPPKHFLSKADCYLVFEGTDKESRLGIRLNWNDFDGDGILDLVIGRQANMQQAQKKIIYDFFLGKRLEEMTGVHTPEEADFSLCIPHKSVLGYGVIHAASGDFNGDGKADWFLFWGFGKDRLPSRVDLFLSDEKFLQPGIKDMDSLPKIKISSSSPDDLFIGGGDVMLVYRGYTPLSLLDLNRDGRADLIIMDPFADIHRYGKKIRNVGKVYVIFGRENPPASLDIATQSDLIVVGNRTNGLLGSGYDNRNFIVIDVNSDGILDLVFVDPIADVSRDGKKISEAGKIFVFFGLKTN